MDEKDGGGEAPSVIAGGDDTSPCGGGTGRQPPTEYSLALGRRICSRVAGGESLGVICQEPGMPHRGTVSRWCAAHPKFGAALAAAKTCGGRLVRSAQLSTYDPVTAFEICERICEGETLTAICRDPAMPSLSAVSRWRRTYSAFAAELDEARKVQSERFFDDGVEIAAAITPETAFAGHVRLTHLRWTAATMAPRAFGRFKVQEPPGEAQVQQLLVRSFKIETREADGWTRVVGFCPNPDTGRAERDYESEWRAPPSAIAAAYGKGE